MIPLRTMKRKPKPGLPRLFDKPKYRQRNIIERMFGWLKENRRIGTRYDKLAKSFAAMVSLACTMRCLRHYFSYTAYGANLRHSIRASNIVLSLIGRTGKVILHWAKSL